MRAPPSARVIRSVQPNYSSGRGALSHEEVNQRLQEMSREQAAPYGNNNRGGYSRETTNLAPPPMNMAPPIAPPTQMAPPIAPPTPINMAPPLEYNIQQRLETPQTSLRLPVMPQNQAVQYQQNQGGMQYGTNGAPAQMTYTGYTVGPNGIPQKITTMETTTVSQVEAATPIIEPLPPVEVNDSRCCFPRDSDELHYSYSNASDSLAGRMFRILLLVVPIGMIFIGYYYREACPIRDMIPYWLMSSGVLWIFHTLLYFLFRNNPGKNTSACRFIESALFYMAAVWFVIGSTWTFGSMQDVSFYNKTCDADNVTRTATTIHLLSLTDDPDGNWTANQLFAELPISSTELPFKNDCYCHPAPFIAASIIICIAYVVIAILIFFVVFTFEYSYNINPPAQANPLPPPAISQRSVHARP